MSLTRLVSCFDLPCSTWPHLSFPVWLVSLMAKPKSKNSRWIVMLPLGAPFTKHLRLRAKGRLSLFFLLQMWLLKSKRFLAHSGTTVSGAFFLEGSSCSETIAFGCGPTLNLWINPSCVWAQKTITDKRLFSYTSLSSFHVTIQPWSQFLGPLPLYCALVAALICSKTFGDDFATVWGFSTSQLFHNWAIMKATFLHLVHRASCIN